MTSTYIIAEAGVNHNGKLELAIEMIHAAKEIGADAIKFQLFKAEKLVTKVSEQAEYQKKNCKETTTQYDMLKSLELSEENFKVLKYCADELGIDFIVTPFDLESVVFLSQKLALPLIKVGSGDITNGPLLLAVAKEHKELILSTGMSTLSEVEMALKVIAFGLIEKEQPPTSALLDEIYSSKEAEAILFEKVTLLHCTSEYPAPFNEVNLRAMDTLRDAFKLKVGFSDHTLGIEVSLAAVARGATVIEKHFTLDKSLPGPDHLASLDVSEFQCMINGIRNIENALGTSRKCLTRSERKNIHVVRRSLVAKQPISKEGILTSDNIDIKRPASGLSPMQYWQLLGKKAVKDYLEDEVITQ